MDSVVEDDDYVLIVHQFPLVAQRNYAESAMPINLSPGL